MDKVQVQEPALEQKVACERSVQTPEWNCGVPDTRLDDYLF